MEIDRADFAYDLAEHHSDWESLVFLCHHPRVGRGGAQIQKYIERHGEEFAFVLYQWYIDNGKLQRPTTPRVVPAKLSFRSTTRITKPRRSLRLPRYRFLPDPRVSRAKLDT